MSSKIVIYSTTWCPYCERARQLFIKKNLLFDEINIDTVPDERAIMMNRSNRSSVPQIFIGSTHVGGCDDLYALEASGKLNSLLLHNKIFSGVQK